MKGHMENGKFHPHIPYKKVRKSRDKITKTVGIRLKPEDSSKSKKLTVDELLKIKKNTPNPKNDIGLAHFKDSFMQLNFVDNPIRNIGNELVQEAVDMEKSHDPSLKNYRLSNTHIFNERDGLQKAFFYGRNNVRQLIKWRNDGNPKTWKWKLPLELETKNVSINIVKEDGKEFAVKNPKHMSKFFDDQVTGFGSDASSGLVAISIMTPKEFLELASPRTLIHGRNDIRGEEHTTKTTNQLHDLMKQGKPIDSVYLEVNKDLKVFSHEGQHRALSAIETGIEKIPVYVFGKGFSDREFEDISNQPLSVLKPDDRS